MTRTLVSAPPVAATGSVWPPVKVPGVTATPGIKGISVRQTWVSFKMLNKTLFYAISYSLHIFSVPLVASSL